MAGFEEMMSASMYDVTHTSPVPEMKQRTLSRLYLIILFYRTDTWERLYIFACVFCLILILQQNKPYSNLVNKTRKFNNKKRKINMFPRLIDIKVSQKIT